MTLAIRAANLTLRYGRSVALEDVSFEIPAGSVVAVIGPNGSGKSSLLRAIAGLLKPLDGSLTVPAGHHRAGVAFVLQTTDVERAVPVTVRDAVWMGRYSVLGPFRRPSADDHATVDEAMARLGVDDLANRQIHELSGGQRQRVLVAQGIAQGSELLLLDEPTTGLDVDARKLVFDVVARQQALGTTVMLTTHSMGDARLCDLVLLLAGRLVAFGTPDDVLTDDHLRSAFAGRVARLADGSLLLDDPHHDHGS